MKSFLTFPIMFVFPNASTNICYYCSYVARKATSFLKSQRKIRDSIPYILGLLLEQYRMIKQGLPNEEVKQ